MKSCGYQGPGPDDGVNGAVLAGGFLAVEGIDCPADGTMGDPLCGLGDSGRPNLELRLKAPAKHGLADGGRGDRLIEGERISAPDGGERGPVVNLPFRSGPSWAVRAVSVALLEAHGRAKMVTVVCTAPEGDPEEAIA